MGWDATAPSYLFLVLFFIIILLLLLKILFLFSCFFVAPSPYVSLSLFLLLSNGIPRIEASRPKAAIDVQAMRLNHISLAHIARSPAEPSFLIQATACEPRIRTPDPFVTMHSTLASIFSHSRLLTPNARTVFPPRPSNHRIPPLRPRANLPISRFSTPARLRSARTSQPTDMGNPSTLVPTPSSGYAAPRRRLISGVFTSHGLGLCSSRLEQKPPLALHVTLNNTFGPIASHTVPFVHRLLDSLLHAFYDSHIIRLLSPIFKPHNLRSSLTCSVLPVLAFEPRLEFLRP